MWALGMSGAMSTQLKALRLSARQCNSALALSVYCLTYTSSAWDARPLSLRVGAGTRIDDCGGCDSTATTSKPAYSVGKDA